MENDERYDNVMLRLNTKQSEIQKLNLINYYRSEITIKRNEIKELQDLIYELNKTI